MKPLVLDDFKRPNSKRTLAKLAALVRVNAVQMTQQVKKFEHDAKKDTQEGTHKAGQCS